MPVPAAALCCSNREVPNLREKLSLALVLNYGRATTPRDIYLGDVGLVPNLGGWRLLAIVHIVVFFWPFIHIDVEGFVVDINEVFEEVELSHMLLCDTSVVRLLEILR